MEDLQTGAEILGCGGGGTIEWGKPLIQEVFNAGKKFQLVDPKDTPDEALIFIISRVGGGVPEEIQKRVANLPRIREKAEVVAARELGNYLKQEPYAYLAAEIGAGNTIVPMYVAAMSGKPTLDADVCGRAKPEVAQSTTYVRKVPITPLAIASPFGDIMILKHTISDQRAEDICRYMAVVSGGLCGVARCPAKGKTIRKAVVPNSITSCIAIGKSMRKAREAGKDPVEAFITSSKGVKVFDGRITDWTREKREAFMWGTMNIDGTNEYTSQRLKVWYKNEFLIAWKNGTPVVTCPDSLCILDAENGRGMSNWVEDLKAYIGRRVVVVGVPAAKIWMTKRGLEIFGPRHLGFNLDYTPIEGLVRRLG
jgi:DUF917 family protein